MILSDIESSSELELTKETILHFTCRYCKNWWSIATMMPAWEPKVLYCCHCGKIQNKFLFDIE